MRGRSLIAVELDPRRHQIRGQPQEVLRDVLVDRLRGGAHFTLAADGTLVFLQGAIPPPRRTLVKVERDGRMRPLVREAHPFAAPKIAPDGRRALLSYFGDAGENSVWIADLTSGTLTDMGRQSGDEFSPGSAPDGQNVIFTRFEPGGRLRLFVRPTRIGSRTEPSLFEFPFGPDRTIDQPRFFTTCSVDAPRQFDVYPDGRSFLMLRDEPAGAPEIRLQIVTIWEDELRGRARAEF